MDLAVIRNATDPARQIDPDQKRFLNVIDKFQPISMEATLLRPFDSADLSTMITDHRDLEALQAYSDIAVQFEAWSVDVDSMYHDALQQIANVLYYAPQVLVRIEAHTDNIGDPKLNIELSLLRAQRIKNMLIALGVDPGQLVSMGYGDRFPIANNAERSGRIMNRRAEFRFLVSEQY